MKNNYLISAPLFTGPIKYENSFQQLFTKKAQYAHLSSPKNGVSYTQRLLNRTLQAVRQIWMQMCNRTRTWSKILFVGQFSWQTTRNALCIIRAQAKNTRIFRKFSTNKTYTGNNKRSKSRTFKTQRTYLRKAREKLYSIHRYRSSLNTCCKHDSRVRTSKTARRTGGAR
jgi:hypothetical protein